VCYGAGEELTVTDANLLLGRLDPDLFFGGRMTLDISRTESVARDLARRLKLSVAELAEGVVRVANANMERAIRVVSVERGHDPRRFALVAFGGAGGMHACEIAKTLEIDSVIVPRYAGVLSALGMLVADVTRDYSASVLAPAAQLSGHDLKARLDPLCVRAARELGREGFSTSRIVLDRQIDVRYVGQSYEITLPFSAAYARDFHKTHARLYGYSNVQRPLEVVAVRVRAAGITQKPKLPYTKLRRAFRPAPAQKRPGRFGGKAHAVASYRWAELQPGATARGPALVTGPEATAVIPPGFRFRIDGFGNVVVTRGCKSIRSNSRSSRTCFSRSPRKWA
jgi:N-methylhydantoinase A/oxoprolinase/acetone carboxylase beta subunit